MPKTKFIGRSHPEENERIPKRDTGRPIQRGEKIQLFRELVALETKNQTNPCYLPGSICSPFFKRIHSIFPKDESHSIFFIHLPLRLPHLQFNEHRVMVRYDIDLAVPENRAVT